MSMHEQASISDKQIHLLNQKIDEQRVAYTSRIDELVADLETERDLKHKLEEQIRWQDPTFRENQHKSLTHEVENLRKMTRNLKT